MEAPFQLRSLPAAVRLGLSILLAVNLAGFIASGLHLEDHHENRDEREGLSLDDLAGAYHGLTSPSPLLGALEAGHPADLGQPLPEADAQVLLEWLQGDRITEDYDNLDLGDRAPAEILDAQCLSCHSRGDDGAEPPLEYFDDIRAVAYSREIARTPTEILITSTHTHAISLATIALVLGALTYLTRWPIFVRSTLILLSSLGLAGDLAGWWLARIDPGFVILIVASGAIYALTTGLATVAIWIDLWRPSRS